jgi:hypothetical protein
MTREERSVVPSEDRLALYQNEVRRLLNPFDPQVRAMSATARRRALLDVPHIEEIVPTLPVQELFLLVQDLGHEGSAELMRYASAEQWNGFVDLGCWQRDTFSPDRLDLLHALAKDAGEEVPARLFDAVDPELLALTLLSRAAIYDVREAPEQVPDGRVRVPSPDGCFEIEVDEGDEILPLLRELLQVLYAADVDRGRQLLQACRFELPSPLTETAYYFRTARLEELGFSPFDEAAAMEQALSANERAQIVVRLARRRAPETGAAREETSFEGVRLAPRDARPLLLRVLADMPDGDPRARVEQQLLHLVNRRMVLVGLDVGDSDRFAAEFEHVVRTASLGLDLLATASGAGADEVLAVALLLEIYQTGNTELARLQRGARDVLRRAAAATGAAPFDPAMTERLEALALRPPRRLLTAEERRQAASSEDLYVPLATRRHLEEAERLLFAAGTLVRFFERRFDWGPERFDAPDLAVLGEERVHVRFAIVIVIVIVVGNRCRNRCRNRNRRNRCRYRCRYRYRNRCRARARARTASAFPNALCVGLRPPRRQGCLPALRDEGRSQGDPFRLNEPRRIQ